MIKEIIKMWNDGLDRGFTVFQCFLIVGMAIGAFLDDKGLVLILLAFCILAFFEPVKKEVKGEKEE